MKIKALEHFHGSERYNCAQAVLKSSEKYRPVATEKLNAYRAAGGGRAPGGLCGALFAAKQEMCSEDQKSTICTYFENHGGSTHCREIRRNKRMSCRDCVAAAAELLEQRLESELQLIGESA